MSDDGEPVAVTLKGIEKDIEALKAGQEKLEAGQGKLQAADESKGAQIQAIKQFITAVSWSFVVVMGFLVTMREAIARAIVKAWPT